MEQEKKPQEIQIEIDDITAQGVYSNLAIISHSPDEFVLDFIFIQPQMPKAKVRARVITSPQHIKRFLTALQDNIRKYEEKFGEIKAEPRLELPKFVH
ncbi:MAG: DUF3467 domain-containing protein [Endomicrobia bacterium]|nr:DUF3467 domain-containing protein [Endomicrobiia bacterium]MCX7940671.1 DUF3467 domain-containing protein [Endomicrobiia bacterium]MDW8055294.1 DUF3467 domain-containing protein [Elusimicrobiota bacterium]